MATDTEREIQRQLALPRGEFGAIPTGEGWRLLLGGMAHLLEADRAAQRRRVRAALACGFAAGVWAARRR